jgi:hypothetical protein
MEEKLENQSIETWTTKINRRKLIRKAACLTGVDVDDAPSAGSSAYASCQTVKLPSAPRSTTQCTGANIEGQQYSLIL